jgi:hypothetical protein
VPFIVHQMKNIKDQIGSKIKPRWDKLGKYGRLAFFAFLSYPILVLIHYFLYPYILLFFIKTTNLAILSIFGLFTFFFGIIILLFLAVVTYYAVILTRLFSQVSIEFAKLFYDKLNEPFQPDKDRIDHSFRTIDAILKYFGVVATLLAGIGFTINYISSQETAKTDREKMLNEFFYKTIEELGSSEVNVNLAGIYSLEQLAINSPKNQWKVIGILTSYVKQHPPNLNEENLLKTLSKEYNNKYPNKQINEEVEKALLESVKSESKKNRGRSLASYKKTDLRVQAAL